MNLADGGATPPAIQYRLGHPLLLPVDIVLLEKNSELLRSLTSLVGHLFEKRHGCLPLRFEQALGHSEVTLRMMSP